MFSGIVQAVGTVRQAESLGNGSRVWIDAPTLGLAEVKIGDSIAINGACMTVTAKSDAGFSIDVSAESLSKTVGLNQAGTEVNLEKSLRLNASIDGHLVSGHVDGTGTVIRFEQRGESVYLEIEAAPTLARYLATKGSITVNGVSLTVNQVQDIQREGRLVACRFAINLIPHTIAVTTLRHLQAGAKVNLEVDMLARYVERMLSLNGNNSSNAVG